MALEILFEEDFYRNFSNISEPINQTESKHLSELKINPKLMMTVRHMLFYISACTFYNQNRFHTLIYSIF